MRPIETTTAGRRHWMKWKSLLLLTALMAGAAQADTLEKYEMVGRLPDGRAVHRVEVERKWDRNHYLYIVDKADVTNTYSVSSGKSSYNEVVQSTGYIPDNPAMARYFALIDAEIARLEARQKLLEK